MGRGGLKSFDIFSNSAVMKMFLVVFFGCRRAHYNTILQPPVFLFFFSEMRLDSSEKRLLLSSQTAESRRTAQRSEEGCCVKLAGGEPMFFPASQLT